VDHHASAVVVAGKRCSVQSVDNLMTLNDDYGHPAGDEMLRIVAERITQSLREDDVVARLGGDELPGLGRTPLMP
jgi:diguanylate cyclase (GGDEF)-like protein